MKRAQYRMLGRIVRGEVLRVNRYRPIGTVAALERQNLITAVANVPVRHAMTAVAATAAITPAWAATDLGRRRHAEQKPMTPEEVALRYPERGPAYPTALFGT